MLKAKLSVSKVNELITYIYYCIKEEKLIMERIVAIHQPNFLPWLGFFYKMLRSDVFVLLDNVQFPIGRSYVSRVKIKLSQGAIWLTVPVSHNFGQLTKDVKINNKELWQEKHLKTLEMNYKRAAYFKPIFELLQEVYFKEEWELLVDFNIFR